MFPFLLGTYLRVELLGYMATLGFISFKIIYSRERACVHTACTGEGQGKNLRQTPR